MKREDVSRYQKAQIKLMKMIEAICKELNIGYFLAYGSLLGAVRHKGFIPWDVDMDIMMYRKDYDIFCKYMMDYDGVLYLDHYSNNKYHVAPHAIVRVKGTHVYWHTHRIAKDHSGKDGIYIDVFPLDNISDDMVKNKQLAKKIYRRQRLMDMKVGYYREDCSCLKKTIKAIISFALRPISYAHINKSIDMLSRTFNGTETVFVTDYAFSHDLRKATNKRSNFGSPVLVPFDDTFFPIPADSNTVLHNRYGDYMQLPPESEKWRMVDHMIDWIDYGGF